MLRSPPALSVQPRNPPGASSPGCTSFDTITPGQTTMSRTIWITGLPSSGKSTLAQALALALQKQNRACVVLDGDDLRTGLCSDLGFSTAERSENVRRVAEVARLFNRAGSFVVVAMISPLSSDRSRARSILGPRKMVEIYLSTPLGVCERRDPKGLYRRARAGEIDDFTGISAPYQIPRQPKLTLDTFALSVADCEARILKALAL
jgi:adenylylsulfate kinase